VNGWGRTNKEIGRRLKSYRLDGGHSANAIAGKLGISRAALYRVEAGGIVKVETLEAIARLMNTSVASLLGAGTEYYASPSGYFARLRELEAAADAVVVRFMPMSYLLTTFSYDSYLRRMMIESIPDTEQSPETLVEIDTIMALLALRKMAAGHLRITSLMSVPEIERFLRIGLVGRLNLPAPELKRRRAAARKEIGHLVRLLRNPDGSIDIAVIDEMLPNVGFQLFETDKADILSISGFRTNELPNVRFGIGMVTAADEPVAHFRALAGDLYARGLKGEAAAQRLEAVLAATA